jgi:hypothetical protein
MQPRATHPGQRLHLPGGVLGRAGNEGAAGGGGQARQGGERHRGAAMAFDQAAEGGWADALAAREAEPGQRLGLAGLARGAGHQP